MRVHCVLLVTLLIVGCGTVEQKDMSGPMGIAPQLKTRMGCTLLPNEKEKTVGIAAVEPGSGAEKAGIQAGDRILKADGSSIVSVTDVYAILNRKNPGDTISVEIQRAGKTLKYDVVLMPPAPVGQLPPDR